MQGLPTRLAILLLPLFCVSNGCTPEHINLNLRDDLHRPSVCVVIFFVDGMDRPTMELLRRLGRLPNIDRVFEDGGVRVRNAIDCIPSATYPNTVSLLTGVFPGHHGVVGNGWFDPVELFSTNYINAERYKTANEHFGSKTLYEYIPELYTFNVQCPTRRGVSQTIDNTVAAGLAYAVKAFPNLDEVAGSSVSGVADAANFRGEWPSVLMHYFPGVDEVGHLYGSNSSEYRQALENVDHQIGRITEAIHAAQPASRIYFILVTDHAHVPVKTSREININNYLTQQCGLKVFQGLLEQDNIQARRAVLQDYDAVLLEPSLRQSMIYLRGPEGWGSKATYDQVQHVLTPSKGDPLIKMRGIGVICLRLEPGRVRVITRRDSAVIERMTTANGPLYRFEPDTRGTIGDPLQYQQHTHLRGFVRDGWHPSRAWLRETAETKYPDFVPQIVEYFDSPRVGDIVVFPEVDFVAVGHGKGEHGACYRRDMRIPMLFSGPDLPHETEIESARIVDIMPTILDMLGAGDRLQNASPLDGQSLLNELRHARPD